MKEHESCCHSGSWPEECGGNAHEYCKSIIRQYRRESSGHKQSLNKHHKSLRGRRGEERRRIKCERICISEMYCISSKASSTPFSSGFTIYLILLTKSSEGHKHKHLAAPPPKQLSVPLCFSTHKSLRCYVIQQHCVPLWCICTMAHHAHTVFFIAGFSGCLAAFNTVLALVSKMTKNIFQIIKKQIEDPVFPLAFSWC